MGESVARVLVIDDELFFREAIRDILSEVGCEVVEAGDGPAGLLLASDPSIGVAIVDIRLPGMDGLEVLRELRSKRPGMRAIMLSAHTDQELVLEALRLGACDYLAKPLHDEELVLAVRRAADGFALSEDWGRLRGRLDRLAEQAEALQEGVAACTADELDAKLSQLAAEAAADVLEASRTSVMLLDPVSDELHVTAAIGAPGEQQHYRGVALGEGVAGRVCADAESLLVSDVRSDPRFGGHQPVGRYGSHSFAVVPLVAAGSRLGVLCATERAGGGAFGGEDLGLLRLLAVQVSEILGHRRLSLESKTRSEEVAPEPVSPRAEPDPLGFAEVDAEAELARLVCEAVVSEVEPERVFEAALRSLSAALPAAPVSIYLHDPEEGVLRCEASHDGGARSDRAVMPFDCGLTGSVFRSGQMVASDAPEADSRFDAEVDTPSDGAGGPLLCVPLSLRGKVVGVFRAFPRDGAGASARAGEVLASALSAAVRNALLYRSLLDSIEEVAEVRRAARQS